ncbi:pali-domain-containing protein [Gyrodon lividus]|nr:pali-domain-containing protein [Gyrodon lividus]
MSRAFCIPGVFFLFSAFVLLFIVSVSLPYLTAMDITRVHTNGGSSVSGQEALTQLRLGIWAYCYQVSNGNTICNNAGHGYSLTVVNTQNNTVYIGSSWTRGLAIHPVACAVTFVALLLSFSQHITVTLIASLVSFLAALITLIAFAIDIALYAYFKNEMGNLGFGSQTITGPGFWLTFVSFILLLLAGCTVCFGRRRDRMSAATTSYPMSSPKIPFFSKFRRN